MSEFIKEGIEGILPLSANAEEHEPSQPTASPPRMKAFRAWELLRRLHADAGFGLENRLQSGEFLPRGEVEELVGLLRTTAQEEMEDDKNGAEALRQQHGIISADTDDDEAEQVVGVSVGLTALVARIEALQRELAEDPVSFEQKLVLSAEEKP